MKILKTSDGHSILKKRRNAICLGCYDMMPSSEICHSIYELI